MRKTQTFFQKFCDIYISVEQLMTSKKERFEEHGELKVVTFLK